MAGFEKCMIDLFAGAGGLSCGLEQAGFVPVLANECNEQYAETYKTNHPQAKVLVSDIQNISDQEIGDVIREHEEVVLVAGGPPCQGFSINAPVRSLDDTRNHLFKQYLRFVSIP